MGSLSPMHWLLLILVVVLLFGSRKLPDAARSLGRSLRILKAETSSLREDEDRRDDLDRRRDDRYRDSRDRDDRYQDDRYRDDRYQDSRDRDERYRDSRYQDEGYRDDRRPHDRRPDDNPADNPAEPRAVEGPKPGATLGEPRTQSGVPGTERR